MIRCEPKKGSDQVKVTFIVGEDGIDGQVAVVGVFNGWDPTATPLRKHREQRTASATVEAGRRWLDRRLRPEVETAAYRIVQEGLTNVARHAGVSLATVGCIEVSDEGVDFEVDTLRPGQSCGLVGMEERARATGGQFRLRSELGRGTSVLAELPLGERPRPDP